MCISDRVHEKLELVRMHASKNSDGYLYQAICQMSDEARTRKITNKQLEKYLDNLIKIFS
jgi:hypothetical protein